MDAIGLVADGEVLSALLRGRANLVGILCGHVHRAIGGRFADVNAVVAPSASHQFALDLEHLNRFDIVREPPQIMLHRFHHGSLTSYLMTC